MAASDDGALMVATTIGDAGLMAGSSSHGPSVAARSHSNEFSKPPCQMTLIRETYFDGEL
jgi:hypothetical protein